MQHPKQKYLPTFARKSKKPIQSQSNGAIKTSPVFTIPELVEMIIFELPAIEILSTCRAVSRTWRNVVDNPSPRLKSYAYSGLRDHGLSFCLTPIAVQILAQFWRKLTITSLKYKLLMIKSPYAGSRSLSTVIEEIMERLNLRPDEVTILDILKMPLFLFIPMLGMSYASLRLGEKARYWRNQKNAKPKLLAIYDQFRPVLQKIQLYQGQGAPSASTVGGSWFRGLHLGDASEFQVPNDTDSIPEPLFTAMLNLGKAVYSLQLPFYLSSPLNIEVSQNIRSLQDRPAVTEYFQFDFFQPFDVSWTRGVDWTYNRDVVDITTGS
ncbi:hypothetical protein H072_8671 [Dactylellina haptotyla CBS 200.50]|uniref:F-box domain-containing protein n=1 Tax=Dactylellina haptotyla (strain CBS 200.50) TaxID=1284197 RepID=S8A927_DACHA|nr:hypothetical protein H072_8671 [Dactylellina haptotyla CBS 200.50]